MRKIIPSITTAWENDWRGTIKKAKELGIKELALFPTGLKRKERDSFYKAAKEGGIESAPLVHIRNDMDFDELRFLIKEFKVQAFNIHTNAEYSHLYQYPEELKKMIFIENVYEPLDEKEIQEFGGICLDITHLENDRVLYPEKFKQNVSVLKRYPIGCNHISSFPKEKRTDEIGYAHYDSHGLEDLSHLDYLKNYPESYFSQIIALELKESIKRQLEAKEYIVKMLGF
ncbi:MAG: hypothetical protein PHW72_01890 [Candidatus Pacebacteria bacterium]|nr:hypothetical protein [Candidatus Paceibacterota bacterium]